MNPPRRSTSGRDGDTDGGSGIRCDGLEARYRGRTVLRGVDLALGHGITALAGANGSGKSTLLRVLAGLHPIHAGSVRLDGADLATRPGRRRARGTFGYLPQDADFPGTFSVRDAVAYGAWLQQLPFPAAAARRSLERVGMAHLADRPLGRLSGGERRRALLAQALVHEPPHVLLDEPTTGIDAAHRLDLHAVLRRHVGSEEAVAAGGASRSVVLATHHGDDIVRVADRVVVLASGRVAFDGTPTELAAIGGDRADAESVDRALGAIDREGPGAVDVAATCGGMAR